MRAAGAEPVRAAGVDHWLEQGAGAIACILPAIAFEMRAAGAGPVRAAGVDRGLVFDQYSFGRTLATVNVRTQEAIEVLAFKLSASLRPDARDC